MSIQRPKDHYAEQAVLKLIFMKPDIVAGILGKLTSSMFDDRSNAIVFNAIKRMTEDGIEADEIIVRGYLGDKLEQIGDAEYFLDLKQVDCVPGNLDNYIEQIRNTHLLRLALDAGLDIAESAMGADSPDQVVSKFTQYSDLFINELSGNSNITSLDDLIPEMYQTLQDRVANPGFVGHKTGLIDYDHVIGGIQPTHLIYVAARPSHGKTSLLLTVLLNMAKQGIPVLFYSYEMSIQQIFFRLLAMESGVGYQRISTGHLNGSVERVESAYETLGSLPFYLAYAASMSIDDVVASTTKMVRDKGVEVAGLDYVQLMLDRLLLGRGGNDNSILTYISRRLKLSAVTNRIAWLVASQLNRGVEQRDNKRPILSDLRDSGSLEQDADVVLMIYRDWMYNPTVDNENQVELLVRKNRHGPIADFAAKFDPPIMKFSSNGENLYG